MEMRPDLEARLAEVLMSALAPCDLGDGIEVVHDVEAIEVEMECALDDEAPVDLADAAIDLGNTTKFTRAEEVGTHVFVRHSAPYERIEIEIDASAFRRATIEEAKRLQRIRRIRAARTKRR